MIIDAGLLLAIILGVQLIKNKFPNFLFFPRGAVLFLPPDDLPEPRPKRKADRPQGEVSVIRIQYANVKDYPFANELSRVVMTCFSLVVFVLLRVVLNLFFNYESLITFYLLVVVIAYTIKLGISTFLLTNYSRKGCLLVAFGVNAFFLLLFLLLENYEGVYDQGIKQVVHDYVKHLEIIFNRKLDFITYRSLLGLVFLINFFIIIAVIPAVIKFGNWYTKTLKEVYHEEDADDEQAMARRVDRKETDQEQQSANLKQESKTLLYKLNFYLVFMLALIVLSHKYCLGMMSEWIVDLARAGCMGVCCYCVCSTMSSAIEFNGSFAYKYVMAFFQQEEVEKRGEIKKKIVLYIYYIWYHYFQFIIRLLLPLFLFLLVVTWKYLFFEHPLITQPLQQRVLNPDFECPLNTNHLDILENAYRCPVNPTPLASPASLASSISGVSSTSSTSSWFFLGGMLESIPADLGSGSIQSNMQKYPLLLRGLMVQLSQQLFWYSSVSIYLLTVGYVLFLRKTVFDL